MRIKGQIGVDPDVLFVGGGDQDPRPRPGKESGHAVIETLLDELPDLFFPGRLSGLDQATLVAPERASQVMGRKGGGRGGLQGRGFCTGVGQRKGTAQKCPAPQAGRVSIPVWIRLFLLRHLKILASLPMAAQRSRVDCFLNHPHICTIH